jgi:hypothetical protein
MAGHSASEDARERAYIPAFHVFDLAANKTWMRAPSAGMTIQLNLTPLWLRRQPRVANN